MSKSFNSALYMDILSLKSFKGSKNTASYKQLKESVKYSLIIQLIVFVLLRIPAHIKINNPTCFKKGLG